MRKGRGRRSERWPRAGWTSDESSVAARTTPPAAAYVRPRSAMRNGSSAGTAPWFMSLTTWPAASQPRARRSVGRLAMSFAMVHTYPLRVRVSVYCSECLARIELPPPQETISGSVSCPSSTALFTQKDFDQRLGCAILAAGAAVALGVSWRFGGIWFVPVLLLVAAADLVLARRVAAVVICYQCDTEYRGVADASATRSYDPHVAERFADVKTVRRMNP